jgi:hypothetical protein
MPQLLEHSATLQAMALLLLQQCTVTLSYEGQHHLAKEISLMIEDGRGDI